MGTVPAMSNVAPVSALTGIRNTRAKAPPVTRVLCVKAIGGTISATAFLFANNALDGLGVTLRGLTSVRVAAATPLLKCGKYNSPGPDGIFVRARKETKP